MNAQQKVAWAELGISAIALIAAIVAYPWLGDRAGGMFGILGMLGLTPLFLMKRQQEVITDERDQKILQQATFFGIGAGWMILFGGILVLTLLVEFESSAVPNWRADFDPLD